MTSGFQRPFLNQESSIHSARSARGGTRDSSRKKKLTLTSFNKAFGGLPGRSSRKERTSPIINLRLGDDAPYGTH